MRDLAGPGFGGPPPNRNEELVLFLIIGLSLAVILLIMIGAFQ